jgi:hypothetical protein
MTSTHGTMAPSSVPSVCALAAVLLALAGCGGGDDAPAATANAAPVAAFTAADSVVAGTPLALDASAASDADGDSLTYSWDFGNGQRGGGKQIAALFADAGDHIVRLTVGDGRGGIASTERVVTVTAGPAAAGSVAALVVVRDASGALLSGVTVVNVAGGTAGLSGADGRTSVSVDRAVSATLRFSKSGYADQFKAFVLPASAESGYLEVVMTPRMAAATLADAAAGGTIDGSDGARVSFEAGSLVDAAGAPVVGAVQVAITPIDVAANARAFPGKFEGTRPSGQQGLIESYGTAEFILTQDGSPVQLAPGRKATIEIPIFTAKNRDGSAVKEGDVFPLWSLNERSGTWIEEGSGRVVAAASPSGLALRGDVTHFSWWNHDQFLFPLARPKPRCLVDTNADGNLEDLTGTGHCWHAGTGPEQPTPFAPFSAGSGRKVILAEPRTQRIPTWIAEDFTPAEGGKVLLVPADLDITFRSYAKNGTLFGTTVVRLGADVEQDVPMLLEPVQDNPGTLAIALPYDQRFAVASRGEVDRFTFAAEAGARYDLVVSRATSSLLGGTVQVRSGAGASTAGGNFGANAFGATLHPGAAEMVSIEVTAGDASPGSYRIEVRKLAPNAGTCSSPTVLTLPSTATPTIPANGAVCFDLSLAADDAIQIDSLSATNVRGTARLFAPNGDAVAISSFGSGQGSILLRFGAASSGIHRLQITNGEPLAGTVDALSVKRLALAGTLATGGSIDSDVNGNVDRRFFLVKPQAASNLAIKLSPGGAALGATLWPEGAVQFGTVVTTTGRVATTTPSVLPVVEVYRMSGQGPWPFALSALAVETIALDADVPVAAPAPFDVRLYRIDGVAGQQWSAGISYANALGGSASVSVYAPVGGQLPMQASAGVLTLADNGPYTVEVRATSQAVAGWPLKIRVNTAAPPEPIALATSTERAVTLALGEVKRYSFDVVQGQVLALQLASTAMDVQASISGGAISTGFASVAFPGTSSHSGPRYVQQSGPAVLTLGGTNRNEARATGAVQLSLQAPTPAAAVLGTAVDTIVFPAQLMSHGYVLPADGKHLLCVAYTGATGNGGSALVKGVVWGPSATTTDYAGDLGATGQGTAFDAIGNLRGGANTLTFMSSLAAPAPLAFRLVGLAAPTMLVAGAGPVNDTLAACQRRYFRFAGLAGGGYTLRVTAPFTGSVRIRKEASAPGDFTLRTDTINLGSTPQPLTAGVERVVAFTIPAAAPHGSGNYIVEIDADGDGAGGYSVSLTTP